VIENARKPIFAVKSDDQYYFAIGFLSTLCGTHMFVSGMNHFTVILPHY
jgi:hypothetical protein